jgi:hypothetical protein
MLDLFRNTKYLLIESLPISFFVTLKWHMFSQSFTHHYTDSPPVHFLEQFRLQTTAAISHFSFLHALNTCVQEPPET